MTDTHTPIEEILDKGRAERAPADPSTPGDPQAEKEAARGRDKRGRFASAENEPGPPDDHREPPKREPAKEPDKPKEPDKAPPAPGTSPAPQPAPAITPGQKPEGNAPPSDPNQAWSYAAYQDEKGKRQKEAERATRLEQALLESNRRLAEFQKQHKAPAADPLENPQGFASELRTGFETELKNIRLENSLQLAQVRHGEVFDKAYEGLVAAAYGGDKVSYLRVMNSPNIGEEVVRWYKERQALAEIGDDPAKWREAERGRIRKEIEAELSGGNAPAPNGQAPAAAPQTQHQVQPSNLAGVRSVGARSGPAWSGPAPLDDIFARGRQRAAKG